MYVDTLAVAVVAVNARFDELCEENSFLAGVVYQFRKEELKTTLAEGHYGRTIESVLVVKLSLHWSRNAFTWWVRR